MHQGDAILFTHYSRGKNAPQPRGGGWSENVHFSMVQNPGASTNLLINRGNKFLVSNGYIFVAMVGVIFYPSRSALFVFACRPFHRIFHLIAFFIFL